MKHFTLIALAALAAGTAAQAQTVARMKTVPRFSLAAAKAAKADVAAESAKMNTESAKMTAAPKAAKTGRAARMHALAVARATQKKTVYLSQRETQYLWTTPESEDPDADPNPLDGSWQKASVYDYEYDNQCNITKMTETAYDDMGGVDGVTRTVNKWNRYNMLTEEVQSTSDDGTTFTNTNRRVQDYDFDTPWLTLSKMRYLWDSDAGKWVETTDAFQRTVMYNKWGNIASVVVSVPYEGKYDPMIRITTTTDEQTGQINTFRYEELKADYDEQTEQIVFYWNEDTYLRDIKWHETTGRLAGDMDTWMEHGDYMQSATISYTAADGTVKDYGTITCAYDGTGSYRSQALYTDIDTGILVQETNTHTVGTNGSYTDDTVMKADADGDGTFSAAETESVERVAMTYDEMGNVVLNNSYIYEPQDPDEGDEDAEAKAQAEGDITAADEELVVVEGLPLTLMESYKADYTYDPDHGNATLSFTEYNYDPDLMAYVPFMKVDTESFAAVETTGIETAGTAADAPRAVYNMQGMRVSSAAASGVYIVKQGGKSVKVAVR